VVFVPPTLDLSEISSNMKQLFPPFTTLILAACLAVALISALGSNLKVLSPLFLTLQQNAGLPEIRSGEIWRLITPILMHFGALHIVFNLACWWSVGGALEQRRGAAEVAMLVLVLGIVSNLAEYLYSGHGRFGGMSGVLYGLFGYIWARGRLDRNFGLMLPNPVVGLLLVWFALCWVGVIPNVANMAHTAGLGAGVGVGLLIAALRKR